MRRVWVAITAVCLVVAVVLFIKLNFEAAFVVAAIGAITWFLNFRGQVKSRLRGYDEEQGAFEQGREVDEERNAEDSVS